MAYNPNIPQPSDQLNVSQGDLLNNFMALNTVLNVNMLGPNNPNQGKFNVTEYVSPTTFAGTVGGEVALFANASAYTGNPALFFQKQTNGASYEFTESIQAIAGWSFLPSGILLKWGNVSIPASPTGILFPVAANIPVFGTIFIVLITAYDTTDSLNIVTLGAQATTGFQVISSVPSGTTTVNYLAFGVV